jgi:PST family polysaccharide transporter
MTAAEVGSEAAGLLKLGFAFMASALMMTGTAYVVRLILIREVAVEAAGLYQAAWTLGGLYVGFILQAMGADFYPRLTGIANDNIACNRLVNEQAAVSLLLAGPGIIATLTFASLVVGLFYSGEFAGAVSILRWICLGMALRIVIWPIGYIILAKGKQQIFFWTEFAWTTVHVALAWICIKYWGAEGAGIAFFASYVFHGVLIYCIVQRLSGFSWAPGNLKTVMLFGAMIASVFWIFDFLSAFWSIAFGLYF